MELVNLTLKFKWKNKLQKKHTQKKDPTQKQQHTQNTENHKTHQIARNSQNTSKDEQRVETCYNKH